MSWRSRGYLFFPSSYRSKQNTTEVKHSPERGKPTTPCPMWQNIMVFPEKLPGGTHHLLKVRSSNIACPGSTTHPGPPNTELLSVCCNHQNTTHSPKQEEKLNFWPSTRTWSENGSRNRLTLSTEVSACTSWCSSKILSETTDSLCVTNSTFCISIPRETKMSFCDTFNEHESTHPKAKSCFGLGIHNLNNKSNLLSVPKCVQCFWQGAQKTKWVSNTGKMCGSPKLHKENVDNISPWSSSFVQQMEHVSASCLSRPLVLSHFLIHPHL